MSWPKIGLLAALVAVNIAFVIEWLRARRTHPLRDRPTAGDMLIGFVTDFFDGLGIGSFAPTTALFKLRGRPADELIPGTLNVGHNSSAFIETVAFVTSVAVDPALLTAMIASATIGAWLGAGVVSRLPRRAIQVFMGVALLTAATFFLLNNLGGLPIGGTAMSLPGWRFAVAVGVNFVLGALMSVGIGAYAPCMVLLALLGLHPLGAFPIMMGTCGLVQPVASLRFFKTGRFAWGPSLGLMMGGIVGVLIAVFIVKSLPLSALRWLVMVVVAYAAVSMLYSAWRSGAAKAVDAGPAMGLGAAPRSLAGSSAPDTSAPAQSGSATPAQPGGL
ncbi:MAG TPA: sulfite exporter TauE/SafE family protein [Steroidobacteraceae bacterium]|nr:sulfite exporter TauE/SafE family protein [Steroidobacteraceae bacterium]